MFAGHLVFLFPASIGLLVGWFDHVSNELTLYAVITLCNGIAWVVAAALVARLRRVGISMVYMGAFAVTQIAGFVVWVVCVANYPDPAEASALMRWSFEILLFPGSLLRAWHVPSFYWHAVNGVVWLIFGVIFYRSRAAKGSVPLTAAK